jgi:hypothetical protein
MPEERETPEDAKDQQHVPDRDHPTPGSDDDATPAPTRGGSNVPNAGRDREEDRNE